MDVYRLTVSLEGTFIRFWVQLTECCVVAFDATLAMSWGEAQFCGHGMALGAMARTGASSLRLLSVSWPKAQVSVVCRCLIITAMLAANVFSQIPFLQFVNAPTNLF